MIRPAFIALIGATLTTVSFAATDPAPAPSPSPAGAHKNIAKYEIQVGDKVYPLAEDRPLQITTPKGEKVNIVLKKKEVLVFEEAGISFKYPESMKVSSQKDEHSVTITAESPESPVAVIQVFPNSKFDPAALTTLMTDMSAEIIKQGATASGEAQPATHKITGTEQKGLKREFDIKGQKLTLECYALQLGDNVVSIALQNQEVDAELAKQCFGPILHFLQAGSAK